ncbi:LX15B lipoxygenase, partial [Machaerirhynchus nigripectus]|nr:LX15B lipoxygenase [Machaerirhynchus nigripectus]
GRGDTGVAVPCPHVSPVSPRCPSYVEGIVALFYAEDGDVAEDEELQDWVGEIFTYGVLGNEKSGRGHGGA